MVHGEKRLGFEDVRVAVLVAFRPQVEHDGVAGSLLAANRPDGGVNQTEMFLSRPCSGMLASARTNMARSPFPPCQESHKLGEIDSSPLFGYVYYAEARHGVLVAARTASASPSNTLTEEVIYALPHRHLRAPPCLT